MLGETKHDHCEQCVQCLPTFPNLFRVGHKLMSNFTTHYSFGEPNTCITGFVHLTEPAQMFYVVRTTTFISKLAKEPNLLIQHYNLHTVTNSSELF